MKSILLNCLIPSIIVAVTIIQFYNVSTNHLTVWKGGGFGMYAAIPWRYREVWFFGLPDGTDPFDGFETEADDIRQFPSDENIIIMAEKVKAKYKISKVTVEVWEARFSEVGTLHKVMLNKIDVP